MKKLMVVAAVAFSAILANADYLYWQANPADAQGYSYAALYKNGEIVPAGSIGDVQLLWSNISSDATAINTYNIGIINDNNTSFYIEYANYSNGSYELKGNAANAQTYADLVSHGAIITGTELPTVMAQVWQGGATYTSAPEPTSALLMLFGLAGLALKRRTA